MFVELNGLLGWSAQTLPQDQTILIEESDCQDGSLVLHHLISMFMKGGGSVCIVGLAQSFTHYSSIASRLSVNLNRMKEEGRFVFIDAVDHVGSQLLHDSQEETWVDFTQTNHCSLKKLFKHIETVIEGLPNTALVIIDDISILSSLGVPVQDVVYFCEYLKRLLHRKNHSLAVLCHDSQQDEAIELLWKQLCYHGTLIFHIGGLETGISKDVHGQMKVMAVDPSRLHRREQKLHFKISDKNVSFFAPGLSAAVIGQ